MDEKAQKVSALSPLISDSVWATNESTRDWKVIGSAAIGRARARSIVGDVGLGKTITQSEEALAEKKTLPFGRQRSLSASAVSSLALRLGLEGRSEQYKTRSAPAFLEEEGEQGSVRVEKASLSALRRQSLELFLFSRHAPPDAVADKKTPSPSGPAEKVCVVQFGSGNRCFGSYAGLTLSKGVFVIIEADRGEDCGAVIFDEIPRSRIQEAAAEYSVGVLEVKRIYRVASERDKVLLLEQNELEMEATNNCKEKVKARKLPMEIVSSEYQWDRKKLTFYFKSDKRVDFRDLVKELYKTYKTRIWMCAVEKKLDVYSTYKHEESDGVPE